jgi:recombination protein RecT
MAEAAAKAELAEKIAAPPEKQDQWQSLIDHHMGQFARNLVGKDGEPMIAPEKFARVALTAIRLNPGLQKASVPSLMGALMAAAQLGLEPSGPLGEAYLVPFKQGNAMNVQLIVGYRGLITLAYRSGRVTSIKAETVHKNDEFVWELGTNAHIQHRPTLDDRGELIGVYAIANLAGGGQVFHVMSRGDVDKIRTRSRAGDKGPWATDYEAMARKTVMRQLFKWLPASIEDNPALGADGGVFRQIPDRVEDYSDPDIIDVEAEEL